MKTALLVCAIVVVACLGFFGYRGKQALQRRKSFFQRISEIDKTELEYLDYISYHGGLPEIPKPQKLNIAVAQDYLLLFPNATRFSKVAFGRWHDIETFTTKLKHDAKKQSLVLWGPLSHLLNRDIVRHFIVIHYTDAENQENHLLLEHPNPERLKELYERLSEAYKNSEENSNRISEVC
ncbi:MAG: hypothetical protein ACLQBD_29950 [Syntrophobacteraceae bacterium]